MAQKPPLPCQRKGKGQPLILVHGFLGGAAQWQAEIEYFSQYFDVIAFDLPGFAEASELTGHDRIEDMADAVLAAIQMHCLESYFLLGHSMGGMIVQNMAIKDHNRIEKLVLYGTGPLGAMPNRFEPLATSKERLKIDGVGKTIERIAAKWLVKGSNDPAYKILVEIGSKASHQAALGALDAMCAWDGRSMLTQITMPTLIVWGDRDPSYRWPQVKKLWDTIPNTQLAVLPNLSHAAHLESSQIFMEIVGRFLHENK